MNSTNFIQTGGWPLDAERLQEMQTAYSVFNDLGNLAGNLTILSGCNVVGTNVSDGYVFIDGEVLPFKSGFIGPDVIIIENASDKEFENGDVKAVHYERYATFGTSATSWPWDDFTRLVSLRELQGRILPPGTNPQLYCGSVADIPQGWQLCDGTNGTPALQGQFIVGYDPADADYNAIGKIGGSKTVTLTSANMPALKFIYKRIVGVGKAVLGFDAVGNKEGASYEDTDTNTIGNSTAVAIRPPFYTLAYIIYKG